MLSGELPMTLFQVSMLSQWTEYTSKRLRLEGVHYISDITHGSTSMLNLLKNLREPQSVSLNKYHGVLGVKRKSQEKFPERTGKGPGEALPLGIAQKCTGVIPERTPCLLFPRYLLGSLCYIQTPIGSPNRKGWGQKELFPYRSQ